jgi:hypothetical protein
MIEENDNNIEIKEGIVFLLPFPLPSMRVTMVTPQLLQAR